MIIVLLKNETILLNFKSSEHLPFLLKVHVSYTNCRLLKTTRYYRFPRRCSCVLVYLGLQLNNSQNI